MIESKRKISKKKGRSSARLYESEAVSLQSLRLIAAPHPKDDLSDEELAAFCLDPGQSPELIRHLIDFVKKM